MKKERPLALLRESLLRIHLAVQEVLNEMYKGSGTNPGDRQPPDGSKGT